MPVSESDRPPVNVAVDVNAVVLGPIVRAAVRELMDQVPGLAADDRSAYSEVEAAAKLGVARHVLRDERCRGGTTVVRRGRECRYGKAQLLKFLAGRGE